VLLKDLDTWDFDGISTWDFDGISTRGPLWAATGGAEAKPEDVEDSPAVMRLVRSGSISETRMDI